MERRAFVKGAFGLAVMAAGTGLGFGAYSLYAGDAARGTKVLTTTASMAPAVAEGPLMQVGIALYEQADGVLAGWLEDTQLFTVDQTGAALISLADGTRSIEGIAAEAAALMGAPVDAAEVASFFVTLGQSGFLQNTVVVNLYETQA